MASLCPPAKAAAEWWDDAVDRGLEWFGHAVLGRSAGLEQAVSFFRQHGGRPESYTLAKTEAGGKAALGEYEGMKLGQRLTKGLNQQEQQILMNLVQGRLQPDQVQAAVSNPRITDAIDAAKTARAMLDSYGHQAVAQGLLKDATFWSNYGRYVPRLYRQYEVDPKILEEKTGIKMGSRLDGDRFMKRQDIPAPIRLMMGEVKEPGLPVAKGIAQISHDVAFADFYSKVASNPDWASGTAKPGWKQLPESYKLGDLSGKWVAPELHSDLDGMIKTPSEWLQAYRGILDPMKMGVVPMRIASFVWHPISWGVLNHLEGMPLFDPRSMKYYLKAAVDTFREGPLWKEALENGAHDGIRFTQADQDMLLDSWNKTAGHPLRRLGSMFASIAAEAQQGKPGTAFRHLTSWTEGPLSVITGDVPARMAKVYSKLSQVFKVAKYAYEKEVNGLAPDQAALNARESTIDYHNVSKAVEVGRLGLPFISFPAQAIPKLLSSMARAPWRMAGLAAALYTMGQYSQSQTGTSKEQEAAVRAATRVQGRTKTGLETSLFGINLPGFRRYEMLPIHDRDGNLQFLDMAHILHWTGVGAPSGPQEPDMGALDPMTWAGANPFVSVLWPTLTGRDPSTGRPLTDVPTPEAGPLDLAKLAGKRIARTYTPAPLPGSWQGERLGRALQGKPDPFGRVEGLASAIAQTATGIYARPADQSATMRMRRSEFENTMQDYERKADRILGDRSLSDNEKQEKMEDLKARRAKTKARWEQWFQDIEKRPGR